MANAPSEFTPPHCPNRNCRFHNPIISGWRFKKAGFFVRRQSPHCIQRYQCHSCRRYFSTQTFHISYWLKRADVVSTLLTKSVGCMANRQIARDLGVAPKTIDDQLSRLGRHCMLYHCRQVESMPLPASVVVDGFETFEHSQYYPLHFNVCVEAHTDFILGFTDSELRRKGRMTPAQKARRRELEARHGRPDPGAVRKQMGALLDATVGTAREITIHSDEHPAYPPAIKGLRGRVTHNVTPGSAHRGVHNPLYPVNLLDLLIRHCQSGHKRETIAFAKRRAASAERLAIFVVWRNYIKARREKKRGSPTPAMCRGVAARPLRTDELLSQRIFYDHVRLPERWQLYYRRLIRTRALPRHRTHQLKYAF
jgi:transposase-like protein